MVRVWNKGLKVYLRGGGIVPVIDNCICKTCSKPFHVKQSQINIGKGKYCSKKCYGVERSIWMKNKDYNPVYKLDFSGTKNPNFKNLKKECLDCGVKFTYNKKYLRCGKCNYKFYSGENHPMWIKNNIKLYPVGWNKTHKEQIRYRDQYKCQLCFVPEIECKTRLPIHHIDYNKLNILPENLVSLCNSCHAKTNFNRDYWKKYFSCKEVSSEYAT